MKKVKQLARNEKQNFLRKYLLLIGFITMLNIMGISFAAWNDKLNVLSNITMGNINPYFCSQYNLDKVRGDGDLTIRFEDEHTMIIEGEVSQKYKAFLHYCVINNSTLPVKFANQHLKVDEGLILQLNQQTGILDPGEHYYSETGDPKLHIQADELGTYEFEIELLFTQFNRPETSLSGWDQKLVIKGIINVVETESKAAPEENTVLDDIY